MPTRIVGAHALDRDAGERARSSGRVLVPSVAMRLHAHCALLPVRSSAALSFLLTK
jgi:hypothetical protein